MADDDVSPPHLSDTDTLLDIHKIISDVATESARQDERIKILEKVVFWTIATVAGMVVVAVLTAIVAAVKGAF